MVSYNKKTLEEIVIATQSFNDNLVLLKLLIVLCVGREDQDGKLQITRQAFNIQFACDWITLQSNKLLQITQKSSLKEFQINEMKKASQINILRKKTLLFVPTDSSGHQVREQREGPQKKKKIFIAPCRYEKFTLWVTPIPFRLIWTALSRFNYTVVSSLVCIRKMILVDSESNYLLTYN